VRHSGKYHSRRYEQNPTRAKSAPAAAKASASPEPTAASATAARFLKSWWTRLAHAKKLGATDAGAEASEGCGLSVSVRKGELENVERNRDKSLGVTVYIGQRRGNASTSDFSPPPSSRPCRRPTTLPASPPKTRWPACPMTTFAPPRAPRPGPVPPLGHDQRAGGRWRWPARRPPFRPPRITNSEGAGVSAQQSHFFSAHTHGFRGGYASSRHSCRWRRLPARAAACSAMPGTARMRNAADLASPEAVGRYAAERALSRLAAARSPPPNARCCSNRPWPPACWAALCRRSAAARCTARAAFCSTRWASRCFPKHIDILEDPFVLRGKGSSPFDDEGVRVRRARWWRAGGCRAISSAATRRASWA
jgi:PmbA protein